MKKNLSLFLFLFTSLVFAQNREFKSFRQTGNELEIKTSDGKYLIRTYNPYIVETSFIPQGETYDPKSHAVVLTPEKINTEILNTKNFIEYNTSKIKVRIQKQPFEISYFYRNKKLLSEAQGYIKTDSTEILNFKITPDEILYGGGERVLGMNRRGYRLQLYNRAHYGYETHSELMNFTMPLVISSKKYMVHFDNPEIGFLDLDSKKNNTLSFETIGGRKTYQVIAADNWKDLIRQYTALTGRQTLPPRWALGNFSSRFGYHSQKEVLETVALFKKYQIPLDAVVIDIYWFGPKIKGSMGNLEFLKDSFPVPKKMFSQLKKEGVKTILVTEPFILTTSKRWKEASENRYLGKTKNGDPYRYDFYFGNTGIVDIYNPKAREWFWNIYKELTKEGVSGWWGDLGEPEVHPSGLIHETGTADQVHNIYGHDWARMIKEGYQKDFPDQRPFILMRAGYSGSQRSGMIPWSGDVNRNWGGLQAQPEIALQMGMQGMAYMHSDLGGFAGGEVFDPELYIRWLQYGVFQPVFRPHAQEHIAPEPVFHDAGTRTLAKKAIELRYKLLPYNYTLAFENNQTGLPFMRPLFFDETDNLNLLTVSKTYLCGNDLLVSPVLKAGQQTKMIYFPKNSNWYDLVTGEKYSGGKDHEVKLHQEYIPVFVRSGAFIPMIDVLQTTDDYNLDHFKLHYYFDDEVIESSGYLYNDDGKTPKAFEKGKYEILRFKSKVQNRELKIETESENGKQFKPGRRDISLIIHNIIKEPKAIPGYKYRWNSEKNLLTVSVRFTGKKQIINIKF